MIERDCRLYLITPPVLPDGFAALLAEALDAGDVAALQLRLTDAAAATMVYFLLLVLVAAAWALLRRGRRSAPANAEVEL